MNEINEHELRKQLEVLDKERVIDLFIKLKKAFNKSRERLNKVENELVENMDLEMFMDQSVDYKQPVNYE